VQKAGRLAFLDQFFTTRLNKKLSEQVIFLAYDTCVWGWSPAFTSVCVPIVNE
jgi:hypothetical protein